MKDKLSIIVSSILLTSTICAKDINIINGWQMKGSDSGFSNMNSFNKNCIDAVWTYDTTNSKWEAYSPNTAMQSLINKSSIVNLSNLKENDGFWVKGNSNCVIDGNITIQDGKINLLYSTNIDDEIPLIAIDKDNNTSMVFTKSTNDTIEDIFYQDNKNDFWVKTTMDNNGVPSSFELSDGTKGIFKDFTSDGFSVEINGETKLFNYNSVLGNNKVLKKIIGESLFEKWKNSYSLLGGKTLGALTADDMLAIGGAIVGASIVIGTGGSGLVVASIFSASTMLLQGSCKLNIGDACEAKKGLEYAVDTVGAIGDVLDCKKGNLVKCTTLTNTVVQYVGKAQNIITDENFLKNITVNKVIDTVGESSSTDYLTLGALQMTSDGTLVTDVSSNVDVKNILISQDTTLQDGLVAYYEFEDNANDSSGNGNDGTEYGGVSYVDGVIGKAGSFDDSYILVNNSDSLKFINSFSVSFWFNTQSNIGMDGYGSEIAYGSQTIIAKSGDRKGFTIKTSVKEASNLQYPYMFNGKCCSDYGYSLKLNYDEESKKYISNGLSMNEWHIMSYIYKNNIMKVYVDGILENTSEENKFYINEINTERLQIGISESASWYPYHGLIDDLRIYDRALSETEIEELYQLGE